MEIEKLIDAFKKALSAYKKAYEENYSRENLYKFYLDCGICYYLCKREIYTYDLFHDFYCNFNIKPGISYIALCPPTGKSPEIKQRIKFLETEIEYLTNQLNLGFIDTNQLPIREYYELNE